MVFYAVHLKSIIQNVTSGTQDLLNSNKELKTFRKMLCKLRSINETIKYYSESYVTAERFYQNVREVNNQNYIKYVGAAI